MDFYLADVFGKEKYSGNQLAVVILEKSIPKQKMQKIANEFHFSETTFVLLPESHNPRFRVRIFTPQNEVPFAGHPTLGTAFIIRNEIVKGAGHEIVLDLDVGRIPVSFTDDGLLWMKQVEPVFGTVHNPAKIVPIINLCVDEIDENFPIQNVSTGIEFMLIPLKKLQSIKTASTNLNNYNEYFKGGKPKPLFLFCPQTYEKANQLNCRMFADIFGIPEDPATGSANGCLAAYLVKHRYFNSDSVNIKVEQGYEIGRKSILWLQSSMKNGKIDINVGGKVIKIAKGKLI
jgi:trans-2,3-dihydro-3-hydroxyanthranilate isomerase